MVTSGFSACSGGACCGWVGEDSALSSCTLGGSTAGVGSATTTASVALRGSSTLLVTTGELAAAFGLTRLPGVGLENVGGLRAAGATLRLRGVGSRNFGLLEALGDCWAFGGARNCLRVCVGEGLVNKVVVGFWDTGVLVWLVIRGVLGLAGCRAGDGGGVARCIGGTAAAAGDGVVSMTGG